MNRPIASQGRRTGPKPQHRQETRLQQWLDREGYTSVQLEDASGICRQSMTQAKAGRRDFRMSTMKKILKGARKLANRHVGIEELFDFDVDVGDEPPL